MSLLDNLKAFLSLNPSPEAEALIAQAEAELAAPVVDPAPVLPMPAHLDMSLAPPVRCVTQYERFMAERAFYVVAP